MITQTIREAIMDESSITPGYVYVVRDGEVIFYVGISNDPPFRLCQHLGIADRWNYTYSQEELIQRMEKGEPNIIETIGLYANQVGTCIFNNTPESLQWSFDIYEKDDAIAVIKQTEYPQLFPHMLELMEMHWYDQRSIVENVLINQLKPYLNVLDNAHRRDVPEKYRRRVKPGASSLALDL